MRVEHGITYHGIALNITTRLEDFQLIDPCGMAGLDVTSVARELGWSGPDAEPSTASVERAARWFAEDIRARLDRAVEQSAEQRTRDPAAAAAGV